METSILCFILVAWKRNFTLIFTLFLKVSVSFSNDCVLPNMTFPLGSYTVKSLFQKELDMLEECHHFLILEGTVHKVQLFKEIL